MPRTRVLVVDDAVVVRKIVTDALAADPTLEVVGTAPNGRIALSKIPQLNPDIITLDVEMPEMDGLQTLVALRQRYPTLPVIMFSTLTERGKTVTMDALLKGANDYVTKPANVGSVAEAIERIREQLIPKIHQLCGGRAAPSAAARPAPRPAPAPRVPTSAPVRTAPPRRPTAAVGVLAIGVSTGGPNALSEVLPRLPGSFAVPIVIVQHMPPMFTRLLAERLDSRCALEVREATEGDPVTPGRILIAGGDFHLGVRAAGSGVVATTNQGPPENSCRPSVDVLFRSVAATYGAGVLAVVLTGMGNDGRRGVEHVREAGGQVLVQDEATSVVWGMPGAVATAGMADEILPLHAMADAITARVRSGASASASRTQAVSR